VCSDVIYILSVRWPGLPRSAVGLVVCVLRPGGLLLASGGQSVCRCGRRFEHFWSKVYSRDRLRGGMMVRSPLGGFVSFFRAMACGGGCRWVRGWQ